jgi:hypothetical protein
VFDDLRVFDKDRIRSNSVVSANGAVEQVSVAHMAEVRLRMCDQRNFAPCFELSLEHLPSRSARR